MPLQRCPLGEKLNSNRCVHCGEWIEYWDYETTPEGNREPIKPFWIHSVSLTKRCQLSTFATPPERKFDDIKGSD